MSNTNNLVHSAVNCMFKFFPSGKIRKLIRIEDIPKLECNFILFLLLEAATEVLSKVRLSKYCLRSPWIKKSEWVSVRFYAFSF